MLCSECGAEGYINAAAQCQCYNPLGDPNAACALVDDNSYEYSFNSTAVNSTCACYASWALGWFLQDGVCDQCLLPVLGPPPNSALASCLTYGGQDPQQGSAPEFSTCWGHGTWSAANENCTCAPTWRAVDTGMAGIGGKEVLGCLDGAVVGPAPQRQLPCLLGGVDARPQRRRAQGVLGPRHLRRRAVRVPGRLGARAARRGPDVRRVPGGAHPASMR